MTKKEPETTIRDGYIKATVWRNEGKNGDYFSVTLAKTYRDGNDKLQDTNSFSGTELLRVAEVAREAYKETNALKREYYQARDNAGNGREPASDEYARGPEPYENGRESARDAAPARERQRPRPR